LPTVYIRLNAHRAGRERAPVLEQLLARADCSVRESDWRAAAFRLIAPAEPVPAVAAAAQFADLGRPDRGAWVFIATPVHYVAGMSGVQLPADGLAHLEPREAASLAQDFNRLWQDAGMHLLAGRSGVLYCVFDDPVRAATRDPAEAAGKDIGEYLPASAGPGAGADAALLRRLMSEIEMWLFEHAVNKERAARSAVPVSGLWLWGGGAMLAALPPINGWTAGQDPLFGAYPAKTQFPRAGGSGVVVLQAPGADDWPDAVSRWLRPTLAELRAGRIEEARLCAGERCYRVRSWHWKFWRRKRPWWESFDDDA
jgi:hypothetical protein